jgi:LPS-assembly lipoprotein
MTNTTRAFLLLMVLALAACGFHLRGSNLKDVQYAFKSLYLKAPGETPFVVNLRKNLKASNIELTATADKADLVLEVVSEQATKQILSLSGAGRVQEYQLFYRVSMRAYDSNQTDWLSPDEILLSRIMTYDDSQVYAKAQEEEMLFKDMRSDAVAQAVRRLYRAKPQPQ